MQQAREKEAESLRTELYGGKKESGKLIGELHELKQASFEKDEIISGHEVLIDQLKGQISQHKLDLLEANQTIKALESSIKPPKKTVLQDAGVQCALQGSAVHQVGVMSQSDQNVNSFLKSRYDQLKLENESLKAEIKSLYQ